MLSTRPLFHARVEVGAVLSTFIDILLWPSLLVAAYHGLAAENVGVLGRR